MLVGTAAAVTFCTAIASVVGIVPREEPTRVRAAGADVVTDTEGIDRQLAIVPELAPPDTVPATVLPVAGHPNTEPEAAPMATTTTATPSAEPAAATAAPVPVVAGPAPAPGAEAARRIPSPAEIQQAIQGMKRFVTFKSGLLGLLVDVPTPTVEQVNELADRVCSAFDQGQTVEQVKATGLAMAADSQWVTISDAGAQYVVEMAVSLYCQGHTDKLA